MEMIINVVGLFFRIQKSSLLDSLFYIFYVFQSALKICLAVSLHY